MTFHWLLKQPVDQTMTGSFAQLTLEDRSVALPSTILASRHGRGQPRAVSESSRRSCDGRVGRRGAGSGGSGLSTASPHSPPFRRGGLGLDLKVARVEAAMVDAADEGRGVVRSSRHERKGEKSE